MKHDQLIRTALVATALALGSGSILTADTEPPSASDAQPDSPGMETFWQALVCLRDPSESSLEEGRKRLRESADLGCAEAQSYLGACFLYGTDGAAKNPAEGAALTLAAASQGNDFAKVTLGECYYYGNGVVKSETEAERWLHAAVAPDAGFTQPTPPDWFLASDATLAGAVGVAGTLEVDVGATSKAYAHHLLGLIAQGRNDHTQAHVHFLAATHAGRADRAGIPQAAVQAALDCAYGRGTTRSRTDAISLLELAGELQRRRAAQQLHDMANKGDVETYAVGDIEESIAASSTQMIAQTAYEIGTRFAAAKDPIHDGPEAAAWFEYASGLDHPGAMLALGLAYSGKDLGQPNRAEAFAWFQKAGGGEKPLLIHAAACIAISHLHGLGTPVDKAKAMSLFTTYRDDDFICYLGTIDKAPADVLSYDDALALHKVWVSRKRDLQAEYLMALRLLYGWGVEPDEAEGERLLKHAADKGHGRACGALGDYYRYRKNNTKLATRYYQAGLKKKDPTSAVGLARLQLADMVVFGDATAVDMVYLPAIALCEKALSFDPYFAPAHEEIARDLTVLLEFGTKSASASRTTKRNEHVQRAYELGSAGAAYMLGLWSRTESRDFRKAYEYFVIASERGDERAYVRLAEMHESGEGVPVSVDEAVYYYNKAAMAGDLGAMRTLSSIYLEGRGVPRDSKRAIKWLAMLAERGHIDAMLSMGDVLEEQGQAKAAFDLYTELAESQVIELMGHGNARLARCYRLGMGSEADTTKAEACRKLARRYGVASSMYKAAMQEMRSGDEKKALRMFERAAEVSPGACYALGQMYFFGQHVPGDREVAVDYMRRAAADDFPDALYFLAAMAFRNEAGAPSLEDAIAYARRAKTLGNEKAGAALRALERRLKDVKSRPQDATI